MQFTTRRRFLQNSAATLAALSGCRLSGPLPSALPTEGAKGEWVNDVHSQLNRTLVSGVNLPRDLETLQSLVKRAAGAGESIACCGARHAGGGQQFRTDRLLVDTSSLNRVLAFDGAAGTVDVEAGIRWPELLADLHARNTPWSIRQKQGGADQLSLGGAIGANIHSRRLRSKPFVGDVEQLTLISPDGQPLISDRRQNADLFGRVIGGYGMFGIVYSLRLRLERRRKLVRRTSWLAVDDAVAALEARRDAGAWHGDFQFAIVPGTDDFCRNGLCSWFEPVADDAPLSARTPEEGSKQFSQMIYLAHADKPRAMAAYRESLLSSDNKIVDWSDDWLRGDYVPGYHRAIDPIRHGPGSELLSELHVPRPAAADFLKEAGKILEQDQAELIYGVLRLVERDDETALPWAKQSYACFIFNLHTQHDEASIARVTATFRRLLDAAIARRGSYYLTYHRFARIDQTLACYPELPGLLAAKRSFDPHGVFDSDWYRYYDRMLRS